MGADELELYLTRELTLKCRGRKRTVMKDGAPREGDILRNDAVGS